MYMPHMPRQGPTWPHFKGLQRLFAGAVLLLVVACVTGRGSSTEKLTREERLAESVRLMEQGDVYAARAGVQRLVPELEAAVRREPEVAEHRFLLGSAYFHIGDLARALPLFEDAAKLDPSQPQASYNAGLVRVTENALRRAHHLPLRGAYDPEETE